MHLQMHSFRSNGGVLQTSRSSRSLHSVMQPCRSAKVILCIHIGQQNSFFTSHSHLGKLIARAKGAYICAPTTTEGVELCLYTCNPVHVYQVTIHAHALQLTSLATSWGHVQYQLCCYLKAALTLLQRCNSNQLAQSITT